MINTFLALLRGINVGGNNIVDMAELRAAFEKDGLENVRTYIQSGNVFFDSVEVDTLKLARLIENRVQATFHISARAVVFSKPEWQQIIENAPKWWGEDTSWKHNLLIAIPPYDMQKVVAAIGMLKPEIEAVEPGKGVLYQSLSFALFGRTTSGKLTSNHIYKQLTIRNYNTATKLLGLF